MKSGLVCGDVAPVPVPVTLTSAVAVALEPPGAYVTTSVQLPPTASAVVAVQGVVPPGAIENVPPAVPTLVTVGSALNVNVAVPELVIVTVPAWVVVVPVTKDGVGPANVSVPPTVPVKLSLAEPAAGPVQAMLSVAAFCPAVSVPDWNLAVTAHVAPGASVGCNAAVQVEVTIEKSVAAPVVTVRVAVEMPVIVAVPVLVNVKTSVGPVVVTPLAVFGKLYGLGDHAPLATPAVVVPLSVTGEPVTVTGWPFCSAVMVTLPAVEPAVVRAR